MLKEKLKKYSLILASGSPRRQQFFKDLDLDFQIRLKEIEEIARELNFKVNLSKNFEVELNTLTTKANNE